MSRALVTSHAWCSSSCGRLLQYQSQPRFYTQRYTVRRRLISVRAEDGKEPTSSKDESIESLFNKELRKRGIENSETAATESPPGADPFKPKTATQTRPPPAWVEEDTDDQLSRSRQLNSEGLEGLIPRASQLVQLGGTFFLSFLPFLLTVSLLFGGIFLLLGDKFVHGGSTSSGVPRYIDPDLLLSEPTADPYVPFEQMQMEL